MEYANYGVICVYLNNAHKPFVNTLPCFSIHIFCFPLFEKLAFGRIYSPLEIFYLREQNTKNKGIFNATEIKINRNKQTLIKNNKNRGIK